MKRSFWLIFLVLTFMAGSAAWAAPVQWTGPGANNHWYEAVHTPDGITWTTAKAAAQARGGYLATVSSGEENGFIFSQGVCD